MIQYTPGPWAVECLGCTLRIIDSDGNDLILVGDAFDHPHRYANACLMAAAPGLLEALRDTLSDLDALALLGNRLASFTYTRVKARAAIQKATEAIQ